jgi:fumarate reductase flavoprotein subunit
MYHQTVTPSTSKLKEEYSPDKASYPLMLSYLPSFMNLSANGARFRDESAVLVPNAAANTAIYQGSIFYTLVSKSQIETLMKEGMQAFNTPRLPAMPPEFYLDWQDKFTLDNPWEDLDKVLDSMVANGHGYKGETLEELAANAGMDLATLTETFNNYEKACQTGKDEDFGKDASLLIPYGEGPYYVVIAEINNLGSVGGLTINKKFQVLNEQKVPIKGLYAVGLISQGVLFSDAYVGDGDGIGFAFTSGRLGGEFAAGEALGN